MQRIFLIVASIVFIAGIGIGVYFFFFRDKATLSVDTGNTFGTSGDTTTTTEEDDAGPLLVGAGEEVLPQLFKITDKPISSGIVALSIPPTLTASSTGVNRGDVEVRYVDRASGNIYAYRAYERTLTRTSNRTVPGIQEVSWLLNGDTALVRFLSTDSSTNTEAVETYVLPATGEGGFFLERGLSQVLGVGSSTLFTLKTSSFGSTGTVANSKGEVVRTAFTSTLSSLRVFATSKGYIAQTKASSSLDGYAFSISTTGAFSRILGPHKSLSILPNADGTLVLYSYQLEGSMRMALLNRNSGDVTALPLSTLTEKCTWSGDEESIYCGVPQSAKGNLPDEWYQGARFFTDRIWKIDLSDRVATLLLDPSKAEGVAIDMVSVSIDKSSDFLFFKNKQDGSLWAYDI